MIHVCCVGAESSGKTTLTEALSATFDCLFVPEYARDYFADRTDPAQWNTDDFAIVCKRHFSLARVTVC